MDATRPRRLRDCARRAWYAHHRCARFARRLGFPPADPAPGPQPPACAPPALAPSAGLLSAAARSAAAAWFLWACLPWCGSVRL